MTQREDFNFNWGRLLLWGVGAIAVLALVVLFFVNLGNDIEATGPIGEQVEWSIEVSEYAPTPGLVTLKGDTPLGFPTETWQDDFMVARSVGNTFEWNMDVTPELPLPVYEIDQAVGSCDSLNVLLNDWATEVAQAAGDAQRLPAAAFAQHAVNAMQDLGCEISSG